MKLSNLILKAHTGPGVFHMPSCQSRRRPNTHSQEQHPQHTSVVVQMRTNLKAGWDLPHYILNTVPERIKLIGREKQQWGKGRSRSTGSESRSCCLEQHGDCKQSRAADLSRATGDCGCPHHGGLTQIWSDGYVNLPSPAVTQYRHVLYLLNRSTKQHRKFQKKNQ